MPKCCYYERDSGDRYVICTTDATCPTITGDQKIGDWGVDDCSSCVNPDGGEPPKETVIKIPPHITPDITTKLKEFADAIVFAHQIRERMRKLGFEWPPKPTLKK